MIEHSLKSHSYSQVLLSRSSSVGFLTLLQYTLATIRMAHVATTNVRPDTSKLMTTGLITGSTSEILKEQETNLR